ncbi:MAG: HAMP domain-containing sensor histidine kinase [Bacteroidales bacterium]|nr:HAMP domain-containing sensor histidine kinase [Bacteroidales bacterium]
MNLRNIYDSRRIWKLALLAVSLVLVAGFIWISNNLVKDLAKQERDRMEIWADATKELASMSNEPAIDADGNVMMPTDIDFLFSIIERNHSIPVLLVDDHGQILQYRNFTLPEPIDSLNPLALSKANEAYLQQKLAKLKNSSNKIDITIDDHTTQHLFYEDSDVLRRLAYYPYIQLAVLLLFLAIAYFALISVKKAEQNKVWVGLSKETAHQLGTPISSLMAWTQLLSAMGVDQSVVADMDKDVNRLSKIADRFSKIGSMPDKELAFINEAVETSLEYMSKRIPKRVALTLHLAEEENCGVMLCQSLFEWVMENLTKNAVDAMGGEGSIDITVHSRGQQHVTILVTDTGKGIPRKNFKTVFNPGYTTKKRGWGLGLTLVKRIIEEYHDGKIYVKESEVGRGTTFCIEIPMVNAGNN